MREEHKFTFTAGDIAYAAKNEEQYHLNRQSYWKGQYEEAVETVRETAGVRIVEVGVTGGTRADVVIDYGDPAAYKRMQESWEKMHRHRQDAERFATEHALYASQTSSREYELSADDVHYFRLAGDARPE